MLEQLLNYLHLNFDESASIAKNDRSLVLPIIFQESYRFYELSLLDSRYVLVEPNLEFINVESLKKQILLIQSSMQQPVILYLRQINNYRIKGLIKEQISFTNGQSILYIYPNVLLNKTNYDRSLNSKMSSTSQSIIRYFLIDPSLSMNVQVVAKLINLSEMSASRGLNELYQHGFLDYTITGKTKRIKTYYLNKASDTFQRILAYSKSPIKRVVYIKDLPRKPIISGYTAFCIQTRMQDDGIKRFAMHVRDFEELDMIYQEDAFNLRMNEYHELELWAYDPSIHGDTIIDDFSLFCLFKDDKDVRIEIELEELARRHGWINTPHA